MDGVERTMEEGTPPIAHAVPRPWAPPRAGSVPVTLALVAAVLLASTMAAWQEPRAHAAAHPPRSVRRAQHSGVAHAPGPRALVPFLRGQTHAHTSRSYDAHAGPRQVLEWYESHGYDFVVFTDHNRVTATRAKPGQRIVPIAGVELTQNLSFCTPRIPGSRRCLLHVNALFVAGGEQETWFPHAPSHERDAVYARALARASELGALAQINHPNFDYSADAAAVVQAAAHGARFLEVSNWAVDGRPGEHPTRPSVEAMWDAALSAGYTLWGTATDDAHFFGPGRPRTRVQLSESPGHAWVMVRAARDAGAIREAMAEGHFYASTGVRLVLADAIEGALHVRVADDSPPGAYAIRFVGMHGRELERVEGREARFPLDRLAHGEYVRAVVYGPHGARAWVQPVRGP